MRKLFNGQFYDYIVALGEAWIMNDVHIVKSRTLGKHVMIQVQFIPTQNTSHLDAQWRLWINLLIYQSNVTIPFFIV
jgi:hypothetical protein